MDQMNTDVEVLKADMRNLQTSVSEVSAKMDMLLSMQVQLARLQEQHDHTRQAVDRAFNSLKDTRDRSEQTEGKVAKALSFVRGGALVGALLFGFAQWYVLQQLEIIKQVEANVTAIDRRIISIEARAWPDVAGGSK